MSDLKYVSGNSRSEEVPEDLVALAQFLDSKFQGPLGVRVGWDRILGFIPGIGDFATTLFSSYIVARAAMIGVAPPTLLRMGLNIAIDNGISMIPLAGLLGDFVWKSNLKNIELIQRHHANPNHTTRNSAWVVGGVFFALAVVMLGTAVLAGVVAWKVLVWISAQI